VKSWSDESGFCCDIQMFKSELGENNMKARMIRFCISGSGAGAIMAVSLMASII